MVKALYVLLTILGWCAVALSVMQDKKRNTLCPRNVKRNTAIAFAVPSTLLALFGFLVCFMISNVLTTINAQEYAQAASGLALFGKLLLAGLSVAAVFAVCVYVVLGIVVIGTMALTALSFYCAAEKWIVPMWAWITLIVFNGFNTLILLLGLFAAGS